MKIKSLFLSLAVVALVGCEISVNLSARSGSNSNDYVGEPLSDRVVDYSSALDTANLFLDSIVLKEYSNAYELLDANYFNGISKEDFQNLLTKDDQVLGDVKEYLKDQWAFKNATYDGEKYLQLTKIVKYEVYTMNYIFTFPYASDYKKLAGFTFREKTELL